MIDPLAEGLAEAPDGPTMLNRTFQPVPFRGELWDLAHLDTFAFKGNVGFEVTVLVIFSSHCFTHGFRWDERSLADIPEAEIYDDGRERRVLNAERYNLSLRFLRPLIITLDERRIAMAGGNRRNFMSWEIVDWVGAPITYAVFFDVEKDQKRRKRLILRVQSAYPLINGLTKRQSVAKKVNLNVLLKAAYEGRGIRP